MGDVEVHVGQRIRHEVIGVVDRGELIIVVVQRAERQRTRPRDHQPIRPAPQREPIGVEVQAVFLGNDVVHVLVGDRG